ncbi:hypothetical protein S245_024868 [Arachis hypogaea]
MLPADYREKDEGIRSENDVSSHTISTRAEKTTPSIIHGCSNPFCRPLMGVGGGGRNFFLGEQHIDQFYASQTCSRHIGESPTHAATPSVSNPTRCTNEKLFDQ